jgi:peptidyl-dipeptidase A
MLQRPSGPAVAALAAAFMVVTGPAWARAQAPGGPPTAEDARAFVEAAEQRLFELSTKAGRAAWVQANFITHDTELIAADLNKDLIAAAMELAKAATRFDGMTLPPELARKLMLLKLAPIPLPAPSDPKLQTELTQTAAWLEATYGKGKYCPGTVTAGRAVAGTSPAPGAPPPVPADESKDCLDVGGVTRIMAESRKYDELLDAWKGWHTIAPPMRPRYRRFVELANQGARELKFADLGAMWRSAYDMPPDAFAAELDRLWGQVRPLYDALHAHVRASLVEAYGADKVPSDGPIPAHLLGNIWAQEWGNIYPLVAPPGGGGASYDLTALLKAKKVDEREMVRYGERFFTSLGFDPLPQTFWERSLFVQPKDRDVVCHASAWDIEDDDYRIKMCIEINGEDFVTVHHELGHNFYQRAYRRKQPVLFRGSANDGFHEAIGDTIALSVTPAYLVQVGLLDEAPGSEGDIQYLLRNALDKIAFLPFGLVIDQWRWKVFSGEVSPADYNRTWWEMRRKYQGIAPPEPRGEEWFDPGAKYHVPANVPYTRYFLARILQFQFHRALCREAGFTGPLYQCSIYGNKAAGAKLNAMLEMGMSRPWPEALEAMTGEKRIDATAILDYFEPLVAWLEKENKDKARKVGWK